MKLENMYKKDVFYIPLQTYDKKFFIQIEIQKKANTKNNQRIINFLIHFSLVRQKIHKLTDRGDCPFPIFVDIHLLS